MRRLLAAVVAALLGASLLASPSYAGAERGARPGRALVVTGYAMAGLDPRVLGRDAHALDIVGVSGLTVRLDGSDVTGSHRGLRALLRGAHRHGLKGELLLSNWSSATGDFDSELVTTFLSSTRHRRAAVHRIARIVRREGWDGFTVDLEAMHGRDRADLVAFVRLLSRRLPAGVPLSMDLGARTSIREYERSGFSLTRLSRYVDRFALMTYSQHGTWSRPGPIGALGWQRRTMKVLARTVPLRKVDLGIAGFGVIWPASGKSREISPRRARRLVADDGATPVWHRRAAEWSAELADGTTLWWDDRRSYRHRLALARRLGAHGTAMWVLGSADPLP